MIDLMQTHNESFSLYNADGFSGDKTYHNDILQRQVFQLATGCTFTVEVQVQFIL